MFTFGKDHLVTREVLAQAVRPEPQGPLHVPIKHSELIDMVQNQVDSRYFFSRDAGGRCNADIKLELVSENHALLDSKIGKGTELYSNLLFNLYRDNKQIDSLNGDATFSMALINSNSMKHKLKMFGGMVIGVCTNGMLIIDEEGVASSRKHTTNISVYDEVNKGLQAFVNSTFITEQTATRMHEKYVTDSDRDTALVQFGESGTMAWSMVGKTLDEYKSRRHKDMHGDRTVWSLYNAATQVMKESSPMVQTRVLKGLQSDLDEVGLLPKPDLSQLVMN